MITLKEGIGLRTNNPERGGKNLPYSKLRGGGGGYRERSTPSQRKDRLSPTNGDESKKAPVSDIEKKKKG